MINFLSMGDYGAYVWPAYVISGVTLGALVWAVIRRASKVHRRLEALEHAHQDHSDA